MTRGQISARIQELRARWVLVETNAGTYGTSEAMRATGSGDPAHNDYRVFVRVGDGQRRYEGCNTQQAPGRGRRINSAELTEAQAELSRLRGLLESHAS